MPERHGALAPAVDAEATVAWVVAALDEEYNVRSLVPDVFEAYIRIFHPAMGVDGRPVSWATVAAWSGRTMHPMAQWAALANPIGADQTSPFIEEPTVGSLPREPAAALARTLLPFAERPDRCWFGVWAGYTGLRDAWTTGSRFAMPFDREMHLLTGGVEAVDTSLMRDEEMFQSPNTWWPDCRSWYVATDIDLMVTHVGGSAACVEAVAASTALESFAVPSTASITWDSDDKNPLPRSP